MKKILFIGLTFICIYSNVKAENTALKTGKYLTKTIENIIPINLFKQFGKKITQFAGKEVLLGVAATSLLYNDGLTEENNKNKEIIQTNNLIKVYAKGQVNLEGIDESLAKRRALEDALYFASMKAGAEVRGFSSIDEGSSLNENFLVQPDNKILDYKIIKAFKENNNYIVEVEAVVGDLDKFDSTCSKRKVLNINEFKGNYIINTNTPSWAYNYINLLLYKVRTHMSNNKSIKYINHSGKVYDFNYSNFDKSYDYKTLINGESKVENGSYIYIPSFSLKKSKIFPKFALSNNKSNSKISENTDFFDKDVISFNSKIEIYKDRNLPIEQRSYEAGKIDRLLKAKQDYYTQGEMEAVPPPPVDRVTASSPMYDFAGGGIAKLAGKSSGPPPESGPTPHGLPGLLKRARNY